MTSSKIRRPFLALAALVLALLAPALPARAQMFMGGMGDMSAFMSTVSRRALDDYARMLKLTPDQQEAVKMLHEGYVTARAQTGRDMAKRFEAVQEKMQETQDMKAMMKEMAKAGQESQAAYDKLEKGFFDDVKALLTEQQQEVWPRIERHRRREDGLRMQFISGQGVDLFKVIHALKLDEKTSAAVEDHLLRYEQDLDRTLVAAKKFQKDQEEEYKDFEFDMSKMAEMMETGRKAMKEALEYAKSIRDVNRQYTRQIEPLLPEALRPKFQDEVNRRAHPRIYRDAWVVRAMNEATGFNDASEDQKTQIAALKSDYLREAAGVNKRWAAAMEEQEEATGGQMMEMMSMMMPGAGDEKTAELKKATNKARSDRKDLDKRVKDKLLAVLTETQKERLPEEKKEGMGMFGPDDFIIPDPDDEESK